MSPTPEVIAFGGSSANPPHRGHQLAIRGLLASGWCNQVIWSICGSRRDKQGFVEASHRITMTRLLLTEEVCSPAFRLDDSDAHGVNTPTIVQLERLQQQYPQAEIWWYTGVDVLIPQERYAGKAEVQAAWVRGDELWECWPCVVISRGGYPHPQSVPLPKRNRVLDLQLPEVSSLRIRQELAQQPLASHPLIPQTVMDYIHTHGLYQNITSARKEHL